MHNLKIKIVFGDYHILSHFQGQYFLSIQLLNYCQQVGGLTMANVR